MKVFIWGTGKYGKLVKQSLTSQCQLLGFIDGNIKKQHTLFDGEDMIYSPQEALCMNYDIIVISALRSEQILDECREYNVSDEKLIIFSQLEDSNAVIDIREKQIFDLQQKCSIYQARLENKQYELGIGTFPNIRTAEELLTQIIEKHRSLARFGDGELEIICSRERSWFQRVDKGLRNRLKEVLNSKQENCLVAVASNFENLDCYTEKAADEIRLYLQGKRDQLVNVLGTHRIYYDAYVSRPYMIYRDKEYATKIFDLFKQIWHNRNVLMVEGSYTRTGVKNDLFSSAKSVRRILGPNTNAFDKYTQLISNVIDNANYDDLILVSLGPTATVLSYDLSQLGYQALDIGQLDNEYEWYLRKADDRIPIEGKGVSELNWCRNPEEMQDPEYNYQIICSIQE